MLAIQKFLRAGNPISALAEKPYCLEVRRHGQHNNLVLFKYDMISSDLDQEICREARGIILDENVNWNVVSRAYNKFFNHGEPRAAKIDWESAIYYEKVDGSITVLYWYANQWNVQTSGSPDASGTTSYNKDITFSQLFWKTWNELGYQLPKYRNVCYAFELMHMDNRVVIAHPKPRIVLHGVRLNISDKIQTEMDPRPYALDHKWELVKSFPLKSLEEAIIAADKTPGLEQEGYVIRDKDWNRIKIKSDSYLALARIRDSAASSDKNILDLIRLGKADDLVANFPEYTEKCRCIQEKLDVLCQQAKQLYEANKHITVRKEFAMNVKHHPMMSGIFAMYDSKIGSIKQYIEQANLDYLYKIMS